MTPSSTVPGSFRVKLAVAAFAAAAALLVFIGTASAACPYVGAEQVFKPWGDQKNYVLAPDGGFEGGARGWALSGVAAVVPGNETCIQNNPPDSPAAIDLIN